MGGFVVAVQRAEGELDFYNIVCDREEDAVMLVKGSFDLGDAAVRVLRPLAQWEITCFELTPMVVKRAPDPTQPPAPARGLSRRLRAD
jgi:hypothetical protein